jgi:hypothetical protein
VTARFTPDGRRLFALYLDGRALRWELDPAVWVRQACIVAGGGFSPEEWEQLLPEQDYILNLSARRGLVEALVAVTERRPD